MPLGHTPISVLVTISDTVYWLAVSLSSSWLRLISPVEWLMLKRPRRARGREGKRGQRGEGRGREMWEVRKTQQVQVITSMLQDMSSVCYIASHPLHLRQVTSHWCWTRHSCTLAVHPHLPLWLSRERRMWCPPALSLWRWRRGVGQGGAGV